MKNNTNQLEFEERINQLLGLISRVFKVENTLLIRANNYTIYAHHNQDYIDSNQVPFIKFFTALFQDNPDCLHINKIDRLFQKWPLSDQIQSVYSKRIDINQESFQLCLLHKDGMIISDDQEMLFDIFKEKISKLLKDYSLCSSENIKIIEQNSSEVLFQLLFNFVPEPICLIELTSHKILAVNKAFLCLTGYIKDEVISKTDLELDLWFAKNSKVQNPYPLQKKGHVSNFSSKIRSKDDEILEVLISSYDYHFHEKPQLLLVIDEDNHFAEKHHEPASKENKFRSIIETSPEAINIIKVATGEFVGINRRFIEMTGYSKEKLLGKSLVDIDFIKNKKDLDFYHRQLEVKREISNLEANIRQANGQLIKVLLSATIINIAGEDYIFNISRITKDFTPVHISLIESENRFRTIVEKSQSTICIVDDKATFSYTNPHAKILFGYTYDELVGQNFAKVIHPESLATVQNRYEQRKKGFNVPDHYEFKIIRKNGEVRDVEISSSLYLNQDGKTNTIAQLLDITKRKNAIREAYYEQQKTQQYINIAAFIMIITDKDGHVEMVNQKACEILGYQKEEIIGKNWFDSFLPNSMLRSVKEKYELSLQSAGKVLNYESKIIDKDSKERVITWHSTPILDKNNNAIGVLSSGEDITERLDTLRILEKSKVVGILWKYDYQSNSHPVEHVSRNIEQLIGYTAEEILSGEIEYSDLIHPDDLNKVIEEIKDYTSNIKDETFRHDYYRLRTKEGAWIWVEDQTKLIRDEKGIITHLNGLLIDVTEKQKSLEIIKENEERYRVIFNSNLNGLIIFNSKGKIIDINQIVCQLYGWEYDEVINRPDNSQINIASGFDLENVKNLLLSSDVLESESLETRKDGSQFYINAKLRWIKYKNEKHILVVIKDITENKANEKELIKAKEKAEESDQLKSAFLANMSHEIRTPMNSIIGFSSLLEDEINEEEKISFISRIKENSQQLLNLINDIIDISRIEANQINFYYDYINMEEFFITLYGSFEIEAKSKNIDLCYSLPEIDPDLNFKTDTSRLRQVITNLLSNAFKFTPSGGRIEFGYKPDFESNEWILFVKDNGIGIDKASQLHVFDRFRQAHSMTHTDYGGTGLGLSISKGIVENLGGKIWLESEVNHGAQFYFTLPFDGDPNNG